MRLATLALGAAVVLSELVSAQKFYGTCEPNWYVEDGTSWMYATCRSKSGSKIKSRLDLNHCVANDNGNLAARDGGRFKGTCRDCRPNSNTLLIPDDLPPNISIPEIVFSSTLTCSCSKKDKSMIAGAKLDLNTVVGNDNGVLKCYGHRGERV